MPRMVRPRFYVKSVKTGEARACSSSRDVLAFLWGRSPRQWSVYKLVRNLPRDGEQLVERLEDD